MSTVVAPHIEIGPDNVPRISGTQTKVLEIVLDRLAHHWDADEIQRQHPYLSLAQIYSAMAYYHDHQPEIDEAIERGLSESDLIKKTVGDSPIRSKLRRAARP
jgi:uncharacterized protein (DUF433 family)